ncbi:coiled-coil domain-containing protein 42-like [Bufo gargarizans]|uniref:coiled-coil domain-containing protein 42-like n=1 Tax=Bufo gargarizans TaxID=30331 RepID=UPI001CF4029A|nr:coiled-coil domain-containing protein 42-like [Bufo gargarizans]
MSLYMENEVKSLQAVKKARRAQEIYKQKEQQQRLLQEEQQALVSRKQRVLAQIQQHRKFWDYLENSVEASEEFQVPGDVLSRYHTLVATSHYLQQVVTEGQSSIDAAKGQLSCFLEEKSDKVLQLDNQLGQLQADLEEAQNQRLLWESRWAHIRNTATKKTLLIGAIKMATLNLFQCMSIPDGSVAIDDTTRQLEMVRIGSPWTAHSIVVKISHHTL